MHSGNLVNISSGVQLSGNAWTGNVIKSANCLRSSFTTFPHGFLVSLSLWDDKLASVNGQPVCLGLITGLRWGGKSKPLGGQFWAVAIKTAMINVNTIDIKHKASVSQRGNANGKRQSNSRKNSKASWKMQLLMDYLLSAHCPLWQWEMATGHDERLWSVWP